MAVITPMDQVRHLAEQVKVGAQALFQHAGIRNLAEEDRQQDAHDRMWG